MPVNTGPALFQFYVDGRSYTLRCRRCVIQVRKSHLNLTPDTERSHPLLLDDRGELGSYNWCAVGVFESCDKSYSPDSDSVRRLEALDAALTENPKLEGVFGIDLEAAKTTLSGRTRVTQCVWAKVDTAPDGEAETERVRLVLTGSAVLRVMPQFAYACLEDAPR